MSNEPRPFLCRTPTLTRLGIDNFDNVQKIFDLQFTVKKATDEDAKMPESFLKPERIVKKQKGIKDRCSIIQTKQFLAHSQPVSQEWAPLSAVSLKRIRIISQQLLDLNALSFRAITIQ